jgi:hypothetical protein
MWGNRAVLDVFEWLTMPHKLAAIKFRSILLRILTELPYVLAAICGIPEN